MDRLKTICEEITTQLTDRPQIPPSADFTNQTIVITGSNTGLGKEAVTHFVNLNAKKVIIASRSIEKGSAAAYDIEQKTNKKGVIEVWELDYAKYASVKDFCARLAQLPRVDAVVLNAGIAKMKYECLESDESSITVNVISTALLMVLVLPILRASALQWNTVPTLAVTSSRIHVHAKFPERSAEKSLEALSDSRTKTMSERYQTSKLLQLLVVREIAERTCDIRPFVVVNTINPGLCQTSLTRSTEGITRVVTSAIQAMIAWTAEEGSRTLVHAAMAGRESHGAFLSECQAKNHWIAPWITTKEGVELQKKIWTEVSTKLASICPGALESMTAGVVSSGSAGHQGTASEELSSRGRTHGL